MPTARVTIEHEDGGSTSWLAPDSSFRATVNRRLVEGGLRVWQELPGCEFVSDDATVTVGPETRPPQPHVWWFCPESRRIAVDGLLAGATVEFSTTSPTAGGWEPETPLMTAGAVGGGRQEFELPHVVGGGPGPIVYVRVRQSMCTLLSDAGQAREYPRPGEGGFVDWPPSRPQIASPVYSCAQTVRVEPSGWGIGTLRSTLTGLQVADTFHPLLTLPVVLPLWFPLAAGDELVVQYAGCNPPPETTRCRSRRFPTGCRTWTSSRRSPATRTWSSRGALPGARVVGLLDRRIESMRTAVDGTARLPLSRVLRERDLVWAYQRLCGSQGNDENSLKVRRGTLHATVTPTSLTVGQPTTVTVTAKRADTGEEVAGLPVTVDGASVGVRDGRSAPADSPGRPERQGHRGAPLRRRGVHPHRGLGSATTAPAGHSVDPAAGLGRRFRQPRRDPQGRVAGAAIVGCGRCEPEWSDGDRRAARTDRAQPARRDLPRGARRRPVGRRCPLHAPSQRPLPSGDRGVDLERPPRRVPAHHRSSWPVYDDEGELEGYRWVAIVRFQGVA